MKKITLYAQGDYKNIELEFIEVDFSIKNLIQDIILKYTDNKKFYATKKAPVEAKIAKIGDIVYTNPKCSIDGRVYTFSETKNIIDQLDITSESMIITNYEKESYVVRGDEFYKSYVYNDADKKYYPLEIEELFVTVTENICFTAPWQEFMYAPKGSKLCIDGLDSGDVYSVTNSVFDATYSEVQYKKI